MTDESFERGMNRLRNQWPTSYGEERTKVIHADFKDVSDRVWTDAVTEVLATCRATPLVTELERAVESARLREKDAIAHRGDGTVIGTLEAARGTSTFAKTCMDALEWKRVKGIKSDSKEWEDVLVHLGKLCGMGRRVSLEGEPPKYGNVVPVRFK